MSSEKFYSKKKYKDNPYKKYGMFKLFSSIFALASGIYFFILVKDEFRQLSYYIRNGDFLKTVLFLSLTFTFLLIFIWGLKAFFQSFNYFGHISIPSNIPPSIESIQEVKNAFIKSELPAYKINKEDILNRARKYFGDKIPYLTSKARTVAEENYTFFNKTFINLIVMVIIFSSKYFLPSDLFYRLSIQTQYIKIPYIFFILLFLAALIKLLSIKYLMPNVVPKTEVTEDIENIRGGGDPNSLIPEIEKSLLKIRNNNMQNRVIKEFDDNENRIVGDTGKFSGRVCIENKPEYLEYNRSFAIYILLYLALAAMIYALIRFVFLSHDIFDYYNLESFINKLVVFVQGIVFWKISTNCFRQSFDLMSTFRYKSIMIYIDFEGVIGKSEIKAGKSITDSFETSNIVIRSDTQFRIYTSKILTENYTLEGKRNIISMIVDAESENTRRIVIKAINDFSDEGIAIRGIDITSESLKDISKANILYNQAKKRTNLRKGLKFDKDKKKIINNRTKRENDKKES